MALAISMLDNIFPLNTKTQIYHLKYPLCYAMCPNKFSLLNITHVEE